MTCQLGLAFTSDINISISINLTAYPAAVGTCKGPLYLGSAKSSNDHEVLTIGVKYR